MQKLVRWQRRFPPLRYRKDIAQIRIRCKLGDRNFFAGRLLEVVKLRHCTLHVIDRDVGLSAPPLRVALPQLARQPVQVTQLLHRTPAAIPFAPVRARRQPHRKRLGKIFIRMLLRIPSRQMPHIIARKRSGPVIVAIRPPERSKGPFPFRRIMQLVRIGERVSRFMPQVHHDLSRVFQVMRFFFQLRQRRTRQIKRNPDNRLARRASPLIRQVNSRTKFRQPLRFQLTIELFDKAFDRRPGKRKSQLANRPTQKFLVRGFRFCVYDVVHKRSLTNSLEPRGHTRGRAISLRLTIMESRDH